MNSAFFAWRRLPHIQNNEPGRFIAIALSAADQRVRGLL